MEVMIMELFWSDGWMVYVMFWYHFTYCHKSWSWDFSSILIYFIALVYVATTSSHNYTMNANWKKAKAENPQCYNLSI